MKRLIVLAKGMHCRSCELLIQDAVEEIPGARVLGADYRTGKIEVELDDEKKLDLVKKAIAREGHRV